MQRIFSGFGLMLGGVMMLVGGAAISYPPGNALTWTFFGLGAVAVVSGIITLFIRPRQKRGE